MDRKLATVRVIAELRPIEGADRIELAVIDGWQCVVEKGLHEAGDTVVYCEVDSFLPVRPEFEWLRKSSYRSTDWGGEGFRIRTIRLRGQISQGVVLPVREFPEVAGAAVGQDVTEALGIRKWDPPPPAQMEDAVGAFPSRVPKTDQERVQNVLGEIKARLANGPYGGSDSVEDRWEATLKLDGASMTVWFDDDGAMRVMSRNWELDPNGQSMYAVAARELGIDPKWARGLAFQGELMGPGIQGNREKLAKRLFFVYDVYDTSSFSYLVPAERRVLCNDLALNHVPVVDYDATVRDETVDSLLELADRRSINHDVAEGLVYKNYERPSISFKVINNKYLLRFEE